MFTIKKQTGGSFFINGTQCGKGTRTFEYFTTSQSVTIRSLPGDDEIFSGTYDQFVNGDTGQPFVSFQALKDYITANCFMDTSGGTGGGGGTADFTETNLRLGPTNDTPATDPTGVWSLNALLRYISALLGKGAKTAANSLSVTPATDSDPTTGTKQQTLIDRLPAALDADGGIKVHSTNASANGQALMAASKPVVIASDQSNLYALAPGMYDYVTAAVQAAASVAYQGLVGDAKVLFLQYLNNSAAGALSVAYSNDNVNFTAAILCQDVAGNTQANSIPAGAAALGKIFKIPIYGKYVKIYVTTAFTVSTTVKLCGSTIDLAYDTATFNSVLATGGNTIGQVNVNSFATGGYSTAHKNVSAATTNATLVKAANANVNFLQITNLAAAARYVKFYNSATIPTAGAGTPYYVFAIPPGQAITIPCGIGLRFSGGLGYTITAGAGDTDTTVTAAGDVVVNINYV